MAVSTTVSIGLLLFAAYKLFMLSAENYKKSIIKDTSNLGTPNTVTFTQDGIREESTENLITYVILRQKDVVDGCIEHTIDLSKYKIFDTLVVKNTLADFDISLKFTNNNEPLNITIAGDNKPMEAAFTSRYILLSEGSQEIAVTKINANDVNIEELRKKDMDMSETVMPVYGFFLQMSE